MRGNPEQYGTPEQQARIIGSCCVTCGASPPSQQSHLRTKGAGFGPEWIIPQCWRCHNELHQHGPETFCAKRSMPSSWLGWLAERQHRPYTGTIPAGSSIIAPAFAAYVEKSDHRMILANKITNGPDADLCNSFMTSFRCHWGLRDRYKKEHEVVVSADDVCAVVFPQEVSYARGISDIASGRFTYDSDLAEAIAYASWVSGILPTQRLVEIGLTVDTQYSRCVWRE